MDRIFVTLQTAVYQPVAGVPLTIKV